MSYSGPTFTSEASEHAADLALRRLLAGNHRYVSGNRAHPHQSERWRHDVAGGQSPFAVVLACADSRVAPELLFDQGLGDLFVLRVAGNILDDLLLGSVEFAVRQFDVPLVLVLGHDRCGAVSATLDAVTTGTVPTDHVRAIVAALEPAVQEAMRLGGDVVDHAVRANVRHVVRQLETAEPLLVERVREGRLAIVGGRYDMESGTVEVI
ncbi:carbonic anhydrase [Deinococcus yavapaiensis]|uniref:carbonic anhydrase n=1 Tax=Deinococcus yavapaiensis KR-236 TaxID=694435 RepID=A0A318SCV7_9DEIO|nr:carbonic anhydrase [Deinococcus yavapaiensis]PYE56483.1 carbonic anhydrase [Deinococcus yavapaiensis KR-236]